MRINKFLAQNTGLSRRSVDNAIQAGRVELNHRPAVLGDKIDVEDEIRLDGRLVQAKTESTTIMLNKPMGYVCSRNGQGSKTVYNLLPAKYQNLKTIGRLDKDSSGLVLLTNDGELSNRLAHPRYQKEKIYAVKLDKALAQIHKNQLLTGVELEDGLSKFIKIKDCSNDIIEITLQEGRNRQIRRTLAALGYQVVKLHRISFGNFELSGLAEGKYLIV